MLQSGMVQQMLAEQDQDEDEDSKGPAPQQQSANKENNNLNKKSTCIVKKLAILIRDRIAE